MTFKEWKEKENNGWAMVYRYCMEDEIAEEFWNIAQSNCGQIEPLVIPKIAEVDKVLEFIKQFQDEQSSSLRRAYDGFNITKNNIELLQKLRRKIKSNFSA